MYPIRKTSCSAYRPLINPPPSLRKISYIDNYIDLYFGVVVIFNFYGSATAKNRLGFGFGIGNLIGGAAGAVEHTSMTSFA